MINPFGAETRSFQSNWVNIIAADALAPYYISIHDTDAEKNRSLYSPGKDFNNRRYHREMTFSSLLFKQKICYQNIENNWIND